MVLNEYIRAITGTIFSPVCEQASAEASSNIALCKYWGKRSLMLNLPCTDSLSISLANLGARTQLNCANEDSLWLNDQLVGFNSPFYKQVFSFLNLFKIKGLHFSVKTSLNIPECVGLASSACGFAALTLCLDRLFGWGLDGRQLSLLARIGSGSACRSLWPGFVYWQRGRQVDGLDSYATPLPYCYPEIRIGLIICETAPKQHSSREAMQYTVDNSRLYKSWPLCVEEDLKIIFEALEEGDLIKLFATSERNARAMHATMLDLPEPILYSTPKTFQIIKKVLELRQQGLHLYYTQDAGPNIKLLFTADQEAEVKSAFPSVVVVSPFSH